MKTVEVCLSPLLFSSGKLPAGAVTVVIDVLRATSSFCAVLDAGAEGIITVSDLEELKTYGKSGCLMAAERDGKKVDFADFGNSPVFFRQQDLTGVKLAYSTTNGTRATRMAVAAGPVITACFLNLDKATDFLLSANHNVVLLCSGWKDSFSLEDSVCAGAIAEKLIASGKYLLSGDAASASEFLWKAAKKDPGRFCSAGEHYARLEKLGLLEDLDYCFRLNESGTVPFWNGEMFVKGD